MFPSALRAFQEGLGFIEMAADIEPDRADDEAEQKWDAPAPPVKRIGRKASRDERAHQPEAQAKEADLSAGRCQQKGDAGARLLLADSSLSSSHPKK